MSLRVLLGLGLLFVPDVAFAQDPEETEDEKLAQEASADGSAESSDGTESESDGPDDSADEPGASDGEERAAAAAEAKEELPLKAAPTGAATVQPPSVVSDAPALLAAGERGEAQGPILVEVRVGTDGLASEATVEPDVPAKVAEAAKAAVREWRFQPAMRDGKPVAVRIRIAVPLVEPPPVLSKEPESHPSVQETQGADTPVPTPPTEHPDHDHAHPGDVHMEVTVHGEQELRSSQRSASDYFLHREILGAAPHQEGADALRAVPGLTVLRSEGLATAHSYSLRGFDAEHGQDIEFQVGGLPINQPSHIHGQGYADLGFLIGEVVDELSVTEGVSDPSQGDFAVAGSIRVGLGVDDVRRGLQVRSSYGSFGSSQQQLIWAPKEAPRESLGAAQYSQTSGFGQNRAGRSGSGLVQHRFGEGAIRYRAIGLVHASRADVAGVVRKDDIDSGELCFHCAYPDATARAQNSMNQRLMAGLFADYRGPAHANGSLGLYVGHDRFRSQLNFTGYQERSRSLDSVSGRGDLIEQVNSNQTIGLTGRYRTEAFEPASWAHGTVEVGMDGRLDAVEQGQGLLDASLRNQVWDERVDTDISSINMAMWGDLDWQLGSRVHARAGLRAAVLSYEVEDRLANVAPVSRPQDQFLPGYRRSAMGATVGPRSSIEVKASESLDLLAAYGQGYRSAQARTLQDGENAPFALVRSGDLGVRYKPIRALRLSLASYATFLSDDVAFDPTEGRMERIGPTRRLGATAYAVIRPSDWFLSALSVTYAHAALMAPPPGTADDPEPPFEKGQPLPYVSPLTVRLDTSASAALFRFGHGEPFEGRVGLGASYIAGRPLPYGDVGDSIPLLDASLGLHFRGVDLSVAGYNLLDQDYAAMDQMFVSDWDPSSPGSRLPSRHVSAGAPLSIMTTLGVTL